MNNENSTSYWIEYIETMSQVTQPIKLDAILEKRMQAFIRARQHKLQCERE